MTINIEDLKFKAIIGILDFEREQEQDIILNITIDYNYKNDNFINYADVVEIATQNIKEKKYLLIEDAIKSLQELILSKYLTINLLNIKLTKPTILPNCKVSVSDSRTIS